jgi:glucose-6-phosphate 1-epimerase
MKTALTIEELQRNFAIPHIAGVVAGEGELPKVRITTPQAEGEMYLHGAHVTSWKPAGGEEVLFLSSRSQWHEGIAIRGGVPICFPWFRAKADDPKAPAHGFVRTKGWTLNSITREGDAVSVTMSTVSDEDTRRWWPFDFRLGHRATFGSELKLELEVTNTGDKPLRFEEASHAYYLVGDVGSVRLQGLDGVTYLDNTDSNSEKIQRGDVVITKQTDNAYVNTPNPITLLDPGLRRCVRITKENSLTTVVWNPWQQGAKSLPDLGANQWQQMLCVEASNVLAFGVDLAPGKQHRMGATIRVENL